ncbi:cytokinin hydroxylase-like [Corylus avellana]|uniref:cytokinin hydroxylase-like n=1 Tax=Corylus avellana TaxID=13451 RepID=UPI00286ADCF1|nr:cytokinin hydroxylase-like [Corylus avellana]
MKPSPTTSLLLSLKTNSAAYDSEEVHEASQFLADFVTREFNAFLWISLIAITALLLLKVLSLFILWARARSIPGPPCPSFYGHSKLITRQNLTEVLSVSHKKYGSVVKLWLGPTQLLVSIKDPTLIKEMLLKAEDKLPLTGRAFRLAFGPSSLFVSSFDQVQRRRESLATELNGRLIERATVIPTKVVDCIMERIHTFMTKGSIDCKIVSQQMAFTLLGATLFGDTFLAWSKATIYEELLMMIAKDACFWASYGVTPFWKRGFWRYQRLCTKLKFLTQDIVQQCRKNCRLFCHMDGNLHNGITNMGRESASGAPSCCGVAMPDNFSLHELNGDLNAREEPCGNIMGVMFHGCLTTAGLIGNLLERLVTHPEIQDKIYSEIIMTRNGSMKQDQHCVDKMVLLLATVYESARLLPAGPLLQRCSLKHDFTLETGVTIPAGAVLVVPVQLVHMDDASWGQDANEFNPYRFLSKTGNGSDLVLNGSSTGNAEKVVNPGESSFILNDPNDNAAFLPFGSGTRACVGQKFVIQGVATLFASFLERYEIRLQSGSQSDSKPTMKNSVPQLFSSPEIVFITRNS